MAVFGQPYIILITSYKIFHPDTAKILTKSVVRLQLSCRTTSFWRLLV